jgi:hypothetical protein
LFLNCLLNFVSFSFVPAKWPNKKLVVQILYKFTLLFQRIIYKIDPR